MGGNSRTCSPFSLQKYLTFVHSGFLAVTVSHCCEFSCTDVLQKWLNVYHLESLPSKLCCSYLHCRRSYSNLYSVSTPLCQNCQSHLHILCSSSICSGHHRETTVHPGRCARPCKGAAGKVPLHTRALPHHVHPETLDHQTGGQWLPLYQSCLLSSLSCMHKLESHFVTFLFYLFLLSCSRCSPSLYPPLPSSPLPLPLYSLCFIV